MLGRRLLATFICTILLSSQVYAEDWKCVNDTWYCNQTGWVEHNNDWYYVDNNGCMVTNSYIDGYYISYTGRMINESVGDREVNKLLELVLNDKEPTWVFTCDEDVYWSAASSKDVRGGLRVTENETGKYATYSIESAVVLKREREYINSVLQPYIIELMKKPVHERILEAHNVVCSLLEYSTEINVAEGLRTGKGACHVYTMLYKYILNACGIDCDYVVGTALGQFHAWNVVTVDSKRYIVDCCWDDSLGDYTYFMQETLSDRVSRGR